jgi:hypothetical protein
LENKTIKNITATTPVGINIINPTIVPIHAKRRFLSHFGSRAMPIIPEQTAITDNKNDMKNALITIRCVPNSGLPIHDAVSVHADKIALTRDTLAIRIVI